MNKRCIGCGSIMQTKDESLSGYTPDLKNTYCRRCFRLKNYGEKKEETIHEDQILTKVNKSVGLAFFLVDYLNINRHSINIFKQIKISKVLVISKSDLLRKEMKLEKIRKWLEEVYQINDQILFISSKPTFKSSNIFKIMDQSHTNTAYIMGMTNAGKSTFINKLLKEAGIKKEILASNKPNTTLDFIKLKIGEYTIIDTPGFSYEKKHLKMIDQEIKPITYQIKAHTNLIINDTYTFSFSEANKVTVYGCTSIRRTYKKEEGTYSLIIPKNSDIILPGIGFLNVKEGGPILTNKPDLEIRLDISEVDYE